MGDAEGTSAGTVVWRDLTVPDAEAVRHFYEAVVGWRSDPVEMGGCSGYNMIAPGTSEVAVGIGHARGPNAE